jgi:16S rRNA (guanine966-N2)-methyltransferase
MRLLSPTGESVRPTLDRIKEAAFNIIQFELEGSVFLDMFSGSGQIGIEALSRGADKVYFFEPDSVAYRVLSQNLEKVNIPDSVFSYQAPFRKLGGIAPKPVFDIVYIDPPFAAGLYEESIRFD